MKKMIFFIAFLIFTRIGVSIGAGSESIAIGNFFMGTGKVSTENVNQILGLLVGPSGQPGAAGVSGRDGFSGLNGVDGMPGAPGSTGSPGSPGANGSPGSPGANGLPGSPGANGSPGSPGAIGSPGVAGPEGKVSIAGLGGGIVLIGSCDSKLNISVTQRFSGSNFFLQTLKVSKIDGFVSASSPGCAGQTLKVHLPLVSGGQVTCTAVLASPLITGSDSNEVEFPTSGSCSSTLTLINVSQVGNAIGVEFS